MRWRGKGGNGSAGASRAEWVGGRWRAYVPKYRVWTLTHRRWGPWKRQCLYFGTFSLEAVNTASERDEHNRQETTVGILGEFWGGSQKGSHRRNGEEDLDHRKISEVKLSGPVWLAE